MPRFDKQRKGKRKSNSDRGSRRSSSEGEGITFEESQRNRRSGGRKGRERRDIKMTKVTCASCGNDCEVPFKPTSNKPVFCRECFENKETGGQDRSFNRSDRPSKRSDKPSNKDLDVINKKLDKIMEALEIE